MEELLRPATDVTMSPLRRCLPQQLGQQTGAPRKQVRHGPLDWTNKTPNSCATVAAGARHGQNL